MDTTLAAQGPVDREVRARFWMTRESEWRIANGGNSKGAVPVHGKPSATAAIPLYDQAALDAAIAAEREACAAVCANLMTPWDENTENREVISLRNDGMRQCAAAIRSRSN